MDCPFCGSTQVMVVNSRSNSKRNRIWRRRKCINCRSIFTTYEKIHLTYLTVIKNSGKRQRFNRAKLYASIYHSGLDKKGVDRGDVSQFTEVITNEAEGIILNLRKRDITTTQIKEIIIKILKKRSPDTLLRYLAYREGNDRRKLMMTIRRIFKGRGGKL